jgi:hypothetical protein
VDELGRLKQAEAIPIQSSEPKHILSVFDPIIIFFSLSARILPLPPSQPRDAAAGLPVLFRERSFFSCCQRIRAVFENWTGIKNLEASESVVFYKIRKDSAKFKKIRPKCI